MEQRRKGRLVALLAGLVLAVPSAALAAFPDPDPNPRVGTPNDPNFDRCEADDEDGTRDCTSYTQEDYGQFGFSPDSANELPSTGSETHAATGTRYKNCDQLDEQGQQANIAAEGGNPLAACLQIAGVRADSAWKYHTGDPETVIAILDTGIEWQSEDLVNKIALNELELPTPQTDRLTPLAGSKPCDEFSDTDDANGDGSFDVRDYGCDSDVEVDAGDTESDHMLDASDLIAEFSDGTDADSNGYRDDIAGWDFFDDDNDPFDASSCCSAGGHGTGRALEAAAETDNLKGSAGMCPDCQVMPLRVWDTFVVPGDNFAMGVVYAADNGASVVEGAVGGLSNSQFARRAFEYADSQGLALTMVSSDINSANHNYPTNYNEAIYVAGSIYDTAPNDTCSGPGGLPGVDDLPEPPDGFDAGCQQFLDLLRSPTGGRVDPAYVGQPITTSFFRNSNLTQYGGKADVVLMGSTGSENTGQASGVAGLLASFGQKEFPGNPLSGNEIRQLMTMTAEDVLPENTGIIGQPDKASPGWDPHFGYGRVNMAGAMERIATDRVPPEAQIDAPDWFTPINVDRVPEEGVVVKGRAAAPRAGAEVGDWELEWACGQDALDSRFDPVPEDGGGTIDGTGPVDGVLGRIDSEFLRQQASSCDGSVLADAGRPAGTTAEPWPANPYPEPDPERHALQIRLTVHEAGDEANIGRYRKTLFPYEDDGNLEGWPKPIGRGSVSEDLVTGSGGEVPPRLYDLDGDNALDVVLGTSSGELYVFDSDGQPLERFNDGEPVRTQRLALATAHPPPGGLEAPREPLRAPAIGDIDGDREPEIVASAGEHVYAWNDSGSLVEGFPVRIDPDLSEPCDPGVTKPCFDAEDRAITSDNHIKRGIAGSPALGHLDGDDRLDIVVGAFDQHVYAWNGEGELLEADASAAANGDGRYPVKLSSLPEGNGAEIITSPAIADLDGDGSDEVILATNEVIPGEEPDGFEDIPPLFDLVNAALESSTGSNPVYAIKGDGTSADGDWPVKIGVAAGDLLPLVLPGHDAAVLDVDSDGNDEVSVSAGTSLASAQGAKLVDGDGSTIRTYENAATNGADQGPILNLADYPSIGDALGAGTPQVFKGGLTLNGAANLLAVNQNLPFNHVVQGWTPQTGSSVPGYPRATDDFQLVSQPAIARVSGLGPGRQVLYGTGLYQLHAYGPGGIETGDWPKFTGGWTQSTPSVGDADGDGDLDVSALTREGWSFLWDTGAPACESATGTTNEEWWTFHHDEHGTANYGGDGRPPGAPEEMTATEAAGGGVELSWVTPGDDWLCGDPERFRVIRAQRPVTRPSSGTTIGEYDAGSGGGRETLTLTAEEAGDGSFFAVLYRDDAGNWGHLRGATLKEGPSQPPAGGPDDGEPDQSGPQGRCSELHAGTNGRDTLRGDADSERIEAGGGRDKVKAGPGDDCVDAGGGRDKVAGQGGEDQIGGGKGRDRLRGSGADDRITGGKQADRIKGGGGEDAIRAAGDGKGDRIHCGGGRDKVTVDKKDRVNENCERVKERG